MERAEIKYVNSSDIREAKRVALSGLSFAKRKLLETDEMQAWIEKNLFQPLVGKIQNTSDDSQIKFRDFLEEDLKNKLEAEIVAKPHGSDITEAVFELANAIGVSIFKKNEAGATTESGNEPWVSPELRATQNVFRNIWLALRRALRTLLGYGIIPMENKYGEVQEKKPSASTGSKLPESDKPSADSKEPVLAQSELPTTSVQLPPVLAEQPALTKPEPSTLTKAKPSAPAKSSELRSPVSSEQPELPALVEPEPSAPPKPSNVLTLPVKKDDKVHSSQGEATTGEASHLEAA